MRAPVEMEASPCSIGTPLLLVAGRAIGQIGSHTEGSGTVNAQSQDIYLYSVHPGACGFTEAALGHTRWQVEDLIFSSSNGQGGTGTVDLDCRVTGTNTRGCTALVQANIWGNNGSSEAPALPANGAFDVTGTLGSFTVQLDTPLQFLWGFTSVFPPSASLVSTTAPRRR